MEYSLLHSHDVFKTSNLVHDFTSSLSRVPQKHVQKYEPIFLFLFVLLSSLVSANNFSKLNTFDTQIKLMMVMSLVVLFNKELYVFDHDVRNAPVL